jgi:hypothetical protein
MKRITGPIDHLALIRLAVAFGNMMDVSDVGAVCKRLRVLPPGAPYWINGRGVVFGAPCKKQDFAAVVAKVHAAMRNVLAAVVAKELPKVHEPTRTTEKQVYHTTIVGDVRESRVKTYPVAYIDFTFPSPYWFRAQGYEPRRSGKGVRPQLIGEDEYIIPTLDGLLAASAAVLYRHRHHIRRCPFCPTYFTLPGKKQTTCGKATCKKEHRKRKDRNSQAAKRARDRQLLSGKRIPTKRLRAR